MEPLGAELKNVVCSRSGTMLYLEIQKGKYTMKISSFRQEIRGTVAYMRVLIRGEGCGQMLSNNAYLSDSWFSGAKTAEEKITKRVDYCGPLKTSHKGFCLAML